MPSRQKYFDNVQAHYDISDDFYKLFLDPTMTYSCAYFPKENLTLEEAQIAKVDLSLDKCEIEPGMTLLEVGCGWGSTMIRAIEKYDAKVVGITLSVNQADYVNQLLKEKGYDDRGKAVLIDWEDFHEPVDRIVTIGALEHFGPKRYQAYFDFLYRTLPAGAPMLQHGIVTENKETAIKKGTKVTHEDYVFGFFISRTIFPGGWLPFPSALEKHAVDSGLEIEHVQTLGLDYAKTLDIWAENLERNKAEAIEIAGQDNYDTYMRYLVGCSDRFTRGLIDLLQYKFRKPA